MHAKFFALKRRHFAAGAEYTALLPFSGFLHNKKALRINARQHKTAFPAGRYAVLRALGQLFKDFCIFYQPGEGLST
jgi:hypothetical protein